MSVRFPRQHLYALANVSEPRKLKHWVLLLFSFSHESSLYISFLSIHDTKTYSPIFCCNRFLLFTYPCSFVQNRYLHHVRRHLKGWPIEHRRQPVSFQLQAKQPLLPPWPTSSPPFSPITTANATYITVAHKKLDTVSEDDPLNLSLTVCFSLL